MKPPLQPNEIGTLVLLIQHERLAEAEHRAGVLLRSHPNVGMLWKILSITLLRQGKDALPALRRTAELLPQDAEAHANLGAVLHDQGAWLEALQSLLRALKLRPRDVDSLICAANATGALGRTSDSAALYRRALALRPAQPKIRVSLAIVLRMQRRFAEAQAACETALNEDPACVEALCLLGELHADSGRFSEAHELFERVIAHDPGVSGALCGIAAHRRMTLADTQWLRNVQDLLTKPLPPAHEINLRYALGKYSSDTGEYDQAFAHYRDANELTKRYGTRYEREKLTQRVARIIEHFDTACIERLQACGSTSEQPVFVIGMPRSGTSLIEQIAASHPRVFGAGELRFWDTAFAAVERTGFESGACEHLIPELAREYLERSQPPADAAGALRVIDKMPANFLYAGLIHAVFPRARIIHMRRHPIDTCLSIYFQNFFNVSTWSNDLEDLAHYYGEYDRATAHWRAVLPAASWLEIPYEALVASQEEWTRRLLEFLGLPWDPRCLEFHQTQRVVITASKWQVRQKMHTASAGRWRHYEKHVAPLRKLATH
jgi:tetratricopeptide (TPR) repeat protein